MHSASRNESVPAQRARRSQAPFRAVRASVLIVALLLAILIAISLTSSIKLALNAGNLADRAYYHNAAINFAEMGIEEAVYAYNQIDDVASPVLAWSGWTIDGTQARRTLPGFSLAANAAATVKVHCSDYSPASGVVSPVIVSRATVTLPHRPEMSKYIEVTLRKRALWVLGLVVRDTIQSSGNNLYVDSWNSDPDNDPSTAPVPYDLATNAQANGSLATVSSANGAIDIAGGKVYGTISMGGSAMPDYNKNNGVLSSTLGGTGFDRSLVLNDFRASFPPITVPTATHVIGTSINPAASGGTYTLPISGDAPAADGYVYYNVASGANIAFNGGTLAIAGKVVLVFANHSGVDTLSVGGTGGVTVAANAALKIYSNGHVTMGGGGVLNYNPQPYTLMIYGTHTTIGGQNITLNGNGCLTASVFAPNANLTMSGGGGDGHIYGAMVANRATLVGNTRFHYDEALANLVDGNPYGIAKWRELQSEAERAVVASKLNF